MSINGKKIMSIIVYYTLIALGLCSTGFFIYSLIVMDVPFWAKIVYFIWSGVVIATLIFDIVCTSMHKEKQISALIVYVLSILSVIVGCILFFMNTGATGLVAEFFNTYITIVFLSVMVTGYMIASWCVGEALVEHATAQDEMQEN